MLYGKKWTIQYKVLQTGLVIWLTMYLASVRYFLTQSQENIFSFRWKRTVALYSNQGTSEFPHFILIFLTCYFFNPITVCWTVVKGDRFSDPMLIIVVLFLFKLDLKIKKSFRKRLISLNGVPLGVSSENIPSFNPRTYSAIQSFLPNSIMLTSFNLHFLANIEGACSPTWFSSGARDNDSPHKVWRDPFLKAFHDRWWKNCFW